jgi:putative FmdB family regulatory protein
MITYEYKCTECEHEFEIKQKIVDDKLTTCPKCEKETLEKVISNAGGFSLRGNWFATTQGY